MNMKKIINNFTRNYILRHILSILTLILCSLAGTFSGCGSSGGGTSGTGGGGFDIVGVLRTSTNIPVQGVQVSVATAPSGGMLMKVSYSGTPEFNKSTPADVTDSQGQFNLSLDSRPQTITLVFQGDTFDSTVDIASVPGTAVKLNLDLVLDTDTNEINEDSEKFEDDEGNDIDKNDTNETNQNSEQTEDQDKQGSDIDKNDTNETNEDSEQLEDKDKQNSEIDEEV